MMPGSPTPYVSVLMITFNHEKYIAQAIESVLQQNVPFPYELIIGDDCSTDGTSAIVERYSREYPEIVRAFFRERNLGFQRNAIETLRACRGRYVALLEGDDYWLSGRKLARQVALLDAHPEYAICGSRARVLYENGSQGGAAEYGVWERKNFTIEDLLRHNLVPTCTVVFRLGLLLEIPAWLENLPCLDWPIQILVARAGDIFVMPEALAVYRAHPQGVWSRMNASQIANSHELIYDQFAKYLPQYGPLICEIARGRDL